jgi:hypothetical protein
MTWHTATVPSQGLASLLATIRSAGGTIACSIPGTGGVRVTWTTISDQPGPDTSRRCGPR